MRQKGDEATGTAPNVEIGTPRCPAFAPFIVGFLEVPITVGILLSTEPTFTLTPHSQLKINVGGSYPLTTKEHASRFALARNRSLLNFVALYFQFLLKSQLKL